MADYYSLLSRAIAALPQSAPETRQAVYERARKALFHQLRSIQPPVAEADIEAEGRALDEAIARLELEAVRASTADKAKRAEPPKTTAAPSTPAAKPATAGAKPAPPPPKPAGAAKPTPASAAKSAPTGAPKPAPAQASTPEPAAAATPAEAPAQPAVPEQSSQQRPAAPLPPLPQPASNTRRMLIIAAVLLVVVAIVAVMALQLRESPEDLARLKPEPSESTEMTEGAKIVDRVGGGEEQSAPTPGVRSVPDSPAKPAVSVAQKAELWVSAPEEASKVKTYPGSVIWRLDSLAAGPGQPLTPAIRGDIDIPGAKLKLTLVFQKNLDPTLSASHTINVSFQLAPGGDIKGVKAIGPIQMRRAEAQSGEQVAGVPVPITDNNFLIGLLRGNRESRNLTLLRSPTVVDLPMQLLDGRAATISLEKGPGGERVFIDALDSWAQR